MLLENNSRETLNQRGNMDTKMINALKRLERAGSENSRVTKKLKEACCIIGNKITDIVPANVDLPRGYRLVYRHPQWNWDLLLNADGIAVNLQNSQYIANDFNYWVDGLTRKAALEFAADIADGLLEELSEWIEKRNIEVQKAIEKIKSANI